MAWLEKTLQRTLYNEDFWLPGNLTWEALESTATERYPRGRDLLVPIVVAPLFLLFRFLYERYVATPLGVAGGIPPPRPPKRVASLHPTLDAAFAANRRPTPADVAALSKRADDIDAARVERWFRAKNAALRPRKITKFNESTWKFSYYVAAFLYGVWINAGQPWVADTRHFWIGFPRHPLTTETRLYYMGVLAFYWSLLLSHFFDVQRKDFWQMFLHHCVTIALMSFSWFNNMVRIGCYIICLHDAVDFWLELAKMAKYCQCRRTTNVLFVVFLLVWMVTRLVVYPLYPLYSVAFECRAILAPFHAWYVFLTLLSVLQVLHLFWFYLILRVVYTAAAAGELTKDSRSDTESGDDEDDDDEDWESDSKTHWNSQTKNNTTEVNANNVYAYKNGKLCNSTTALDDSDYK